MKILIGTLVSFGISYGAYRKNSLTFSGFIAALGLGTLVYYFGGLYFWTIMISFFISSSILTILYKDQKEKVEDIHEKSGGRDYMQVMANGALGLLFSALFYFTGAHLYIVAYSIAFAASAADTWASEVGVLSKEVPVSILTFKPVERGVSGGITVLGTIFSFLGATFISSVFFIGYILTFGYEERLVLMALIVAFGGFIGCLIDSFLGATIQVKYIVEENNLITEKTIYKGQRTRYFKGIKFFNNDMVNFSSGLLAVAVVFVFLYAKKII